jgi:hypothetical protein
VKAQGTLVTPHELPSPSTRPTGAGVRLVKANGAIKFRHHWYPVNAPVGAHVIVTLNGEELAVTHKDKIVTRFGPMETV